MLIRESGMPNEQIWHNFFNIDDIYKQFKFPNKLDYLIDLACGYGTFLIPFAKRIDGNLIGIDLNGSNLKLCAEKLAREKIANVKLIEGDIFDQSPLKGSKTDYILLFNIMHTKRPLELLKQCNLLLKNGGKVAIMHWNYDKSTPRGPSMEIRPKKSNLCDLLLKAGFYIIDSEIDLKPYHFGILAEKKNL